MRRGFQSSGLSQPLVIDLLCLSGLCCSCRVRVCMLFVWFECTSNIEQHYLCRCCMLHVFACSPLNVAFEVGYRFLSRFLCTFSLIQWFVKSYRYFIVVYCWCCFRTNSEICGCITRKYTNQSFRNVCSELLCANRTSQMFETRCRSDPPDHGRRKHWIRMDRRHQAWPFAISLRPPTLTTPPASLRREHSPNPEVGISKVLRTPHPRRLWCRS